VSEVSESLPVPVDDGAADHLLGGEVPSLSLPSTLGGQLKLAEAARALLVVYVYPRTARPVSRCPKAGMRSRVLAAALRRVAPSAITFRISPPTEHL
jgi:peroxiredoxin